MKYYFVAFLDKRILNLLAEEKCNILIAYGSFNEERFEKYNLKDYPFDIFLDCGAFTAWTKGIKINLENYLRFTTKYVDSFEKIASLDIQPEGSKKEDFQYSGEQSFKNYQRMKQYLPLTKLVPTLHYGEDFQYLEEYIKDGVELIALGGMAGLIRDSASFRVKMSLPWLAEIFKKYPNQRFHGFGMFTKNILLNFPFYSTDSSYWIHSMRYGNVFQFNPKRKSIELRWYKRKKDWLMMYSQGFRGDFTKLSEPHFSETLGRERLAIKETKKYIDFITKLWKFRGIVWT
jgi:hypothetical protein